MIPQIKILHTARVLSLNTSMIDVSDRGVIKTGTDKVNKKDNLKVISKTHHIIQDKL
jgi:hypothetical protein